MQSFYQVAVLLVLNFAGFSILGLNQDNHAHAVEVKNTMIFNAFVMCQVSKASLLSSLFLKHMEWVLILQVFQIFNEFNARKPDEMNVFRGVTKNPLFVGIVGVTFILQVGQ